jgi:hypothetical protein
MAMQAPQSLNKDSRKRLEVSKSSDKTFAADEANEVEQVPG